MAPPSLTLSSAKDSKLGSISTTFNDHSGINKHHDHDDLASYLNEDALLSAGPEGANGLAGLDDGMGMEMDMSMGIGMGMGLDGDNGMSWVDDNKGSPELRGVSPDAFLSEPVFPMPFSPDHHNPHHFQPHFNHSSPPQQHTFNPSLSLLPPFPSPSTPMPIPMGMPLHHPHPPPMFPNASLPAGPFSPHGEHPPFLFPGSVPAALGGTIPGAFLHAPHPNGMMEPHPPSTWVPMDHAAHSMNLMTMDSSPISSPPPPTPTAMPAAKPKSSRRRTSVGKDKAPAVKAMAALTPVAPAAPVLPDPVVEEMLQTVLEDDEEEPLQEKRPSKRQRCDSEPASVAGSTMTSLDSLDGSGSNNESSQLSNSIEGLLSTPGDSENPSVKLEDDGVDGDGISKKKKPFKPWNVSPASSHLPSGSACINPVTGEVELPPLDNLTKEEIRKVKNRASAQRSRTRKVEWASGLREENDRLRQEIDVLRAGMEGAGMSMGMAQPGGGDDIEKETLKTLIGHLRSQLHAEKSSREQADAEMMSLRAQLESAKAAVAASASVIKSDLPSPARSVDDLDVLRDLVEDQEEAERGELNSVRGGKREMRAMKKDGKGVLMMVVLFSFALFSMPPNLRSSTFSAAFPSRLLESSSGSSSAMLGRVLPFDDILNVSQSEADADMTCTEAGVDSEAREEEADKCPAKDSAPASPDSLKFQRMDIGRGLPSGNSTMKGRKSLSLTLLKPYDKESSALDQKGEVEDVLEKWLGLSLFDDSPSSGDASAAESSSDGAEGSKMPGAWVVVKAMTSSSGTETPAASESRAESVDAQSTTAGTDTPSQQGFKAWDGSEIEPMDLDSELLTISEARAPFQPDLRRGFESTLAPEIKDMEELLETSRPAVGDQQQQATLAIPATRPAGRRASDASTTSTISVPAGTVAGSGYRQVPPSAALMALTSTQTAASQARQLSHLQQAEKYVKLELEVDLEMELTCKAVRRRTIGDMNGFSVVGREELGKMLDGASSFHGQGQNFLSLEV